MGPARCFGSLVVRLLALMVASVSATAGEVGRLSDFPKFIEEKVLAMQRLCRDFDDSQNVGDATGVYSFRFSGESGRVVLVADGEVCRGRHKGANCHTWGCDISIFQERGLVTSCPYLTSLRAVFS